MDIGEGLNAPFNGTFKTIGGIRMRKFHRGLDGCEDVFGSVFSFASKSGDALIVALSIRNVPGDFDAPMIMPCGSLIPSAKYQSSYHPCAGEPFRNAHTLPA